jgi:hypothetical protein
MATIYEIPLSPQAQRVRVDIGAATYTLTLRWNQFMAAWVMDIHDLNDIPLALRGLNGVPLVTGTDLLGQFRYLGIGGGVPMIAMTIGPGRSPDEVPSYTDLGIDSHLFFETLV